MVQFNNVLTWSCLATLATMATAVPTYYQQEASVIKVPLHKRTNINKLARRGKAETSTYGHSASLFTDHSEFFADIEIGTPSQNFSVVLDTGSDKLWVQSTTCPVDYCPFNRYDPTKSSTSSDAKLKLEIGYLDGSGATGEFYYDKVTLAGLTLDHILVGASEQNGTLGTGNNVSNAHPEGLMGLSFAFPINSESNDTYDPFVFQLVKEKKIQDPIFSFYYGDIKKDGYDTGAEITIGGVDSEKYTGEIEYTPVVPDKDGKYGYWQSYGQSIKIVGSDGSSADVWDFSNELIPTIMDSGTTSILLPTNVSEAIYLGLTGLTAPEIITDESSNETAWKVDCSFVNSTEHLFEISLSHYNDDTKVDDAPLKLSIPASTFVAEVTELENTCVWVIPPTEDNEILFGQRFLQYFYTVHNMKTREIGFAPAIEKEGKVYV